MQINPDHPTDDDVGLSDHEIEDDSRHYGIWPSLAGYGVAAALISLMFYFADGMV
ncbi:MAG: hypothetical protein JJ959_19320 [Nisaea sp.]|jgi:uncharacterized membrane protein YjjP (DUF1212 family)|uniref:hypothetical protein n=1 Tax=Nisaea sp. TaxID=2024842 RepID=UPI001B0C876B|nr:hypothetical protein [Nisaea sp.]MBO6562707.1 hypothetical protein [Nisaea sp.]